MATIEKMLSANEIFGKLTHEKRSEVIKSGLHRQFMKGEVISLIGDVWPYLFFIEKGNISAYKQSIEGRS